MDDSLKKILLLNSDSNARVFLTEFLCNQPEQFQLLTSATNENTFEILATEDIFLLVIFIEECQDFPHALLKKVIAGYPQLEIILALPKDNDQIRNAIPPHSSLHVLEKPFELSLIDRLIKKISSHKQNQGFTGKLKITRLDDLVQMCCLSGTTITIQVNNEMHQGAIFIQEGDIVHAQCSDKEGEEAFYTIMTWHNGGFETLDGNPGQDVTITTNYQYLLLEAARRNDESGKKLEDDNTPTMTTKIKSAEAGKLRVLMVEDSTLMAKIMSTMLLVAGDIEVAGIAHNGKEALEMMELLQFDVILLDVNMPVMNGRITMKHIMIKSPCPVIIMSNVGTRAPEAILSLLDLGAVDFISKPIRGESPLLQQQKIVERIRESARAQTSVFKRFRNSKVIQNPINSEADYGRSTAERLVIVSSGCSGHGALYQLVSGVRETERLSFVCLNSIPVTFLPAMSSHLGRLCQQNVTPITDGTPLQNGRFYIDSQKRSLRLQESDNSILLRSQLGRQDSENDPGYFDLFLFSAADFFQDRLLIILLSGAEIGNMEGLHYVREKGGSIFTQHHSSCMMPDSLTPIIQEKLTDEEIQPEAIAGRVVSWTDESFLL
ncbi:MAG: chemotaxis protein CheB [Pseudomonadota bacterium]|nr:chemotaxis protein CheB [Pseudomonadota bacterium]